MVSVAVTVVGGRKTSPAGASQIADTDFAEALIRSIRESRLFAAANEQGATYHLEAFISVLQQPLFGFNMTATLEVSYRLVNSKNGEVMLDKTISTSYTATTRDAFAGVTRLRLANEGAARANIEEVIQAISALKLP